MVASVQLLEPALHSMAQVPLEQCMVALRHDWGPWHSTLHARSSGQCNCAASQLPMLPQTNLQLKPGGQVTEVASQLLNSQSIVHRPAAQLVQGSGQPLPSGVRFSPHSRGKIPPEPASPPALPPPAPPPAPVPLVTLLP